MAPPVVAWHPSCQFLDLLSQKLQDLSAFITMFIGTRQSQDHLTEPLAPRLIPVNLFTNQPFHDMLEVSFQTFQ
jgi:hypothetical protein